MNKHTPAPWTVNPKAKTNIRHGNLTIANCSSTHDGSRAEEEIANAKLIAAAPELLEACISMEKNYREMAYAIGEEGLLTEDTSYQLIVIAIKKATE